MFLLKIQNLAIPEAFILQAPNTFPEDHMDTESDSSENEDESSYTGSGSSKSNHSEEAEIAPPLQPNRPSRSCVKSVATGHVSGGKESGKEQDDADSGSQAKTPDGSQKLNEEHSPLSLLVNAAKTKDPATLSIPTAASTSVSVSGTDAVDSSKLPGSEDANSAAVSTSVAVNNAATIPAAAPGNLTDASQPTVTDATPEDNPTAAIQPDKRKRSDAPEDSGHEESNKDDAQEPVQKRQKADSEKNAAANREATDKGSKTGKEAKNSKEIVSPSRRSPRIRNRSKSPNADENNSD